MRNVYKRFIFVILIIFLLFGRKVNAANAYFVWEKTVIDVPLNAPLEEYKDDYVLKLYVDGKLSDDYYVEYQTNCSTFSTVLTHKIGRYTVYYKAYSKNNYISSEQAIIFNVVDMTPPSLELVSDPVIIDYGTTLKDINFYKISDDTCAQKDIIINLNDQSVIYSNLGLYQANISATDLSGNMITKKFSVKIVDNIAPNIVIIKPLVFDYMEEVKWEEYVRCQDNYDNDITQLIECYDLDTSKLGRSEITLEVSDYSKNKCSVKVEVVVADKTSPIINLKTEELTLDIRSFATYDNDYFKEYIYNYSDNYSQKENIILEIDTSNLCENVADFHVNFTAIDENNNKTIKKLIVKFREMIGPMIDGPDEININIGDALDLSRLVTVSDLYDDGVSSRLEIDDDGFNNLLSGTYRIKYTSFNTSGIYSEKIVTVNVIGEENNDYLLPMILIVGSIVLLAGVVVTIIIVKRRRFH